MNVNMKLGSLVLVLESGITIRNLPVPGTSDFSVLVKSHTTLAVFGQIFGLKYLVFGLKYPVFVLKYPVFDLKYHCVTS